MSPKARRPAGPPELAQVAVFHGETSHFIVLAGLARKKII
jgi:hypothetical protein